MATDAFDILSRADAARQLRIDAEYQSDGTWDDPDNGALLETAVRQAVQFVSVQTGLPLLDEIGVWELPVPMTSDYPLTLPSMFVRSVGAIAYWQPDQRAREEPKGRVQVRDSLGEFADTTDAQANVFGFELSLTAEVAGLVDADFAKTVTLTAAPGAPRHLTVSVPQGIPADRVRVQQRRSGSVVSTFPGTNQSLEPVRAADGDPVRDYFVLADGDGDPSPLASAVLQQSDVFVLQVAPIVPGGIGRMQRRQKFRDTLVYPPADGWPDTLSGLPMEVTTTIGYDLSPEHNARQAVIVAARLFFEQPDVLDQHHALHALLAPIRVWPR